mmetsp:Transcript_95867/g.240268  ORF Transcript_95867/g.240268 Transcript_95867/m.240268 type:complete len:625 (+) Transcript_95867:67-1941(+)
MASTSNDRSSTGRHGVLALGGAAAAAATVLRSGSGSNFVGGPSSALAPFQAIATTADRDAMAPAVRRAGFAGDGFTVPGVQMSSASCGVAAAALALGACKGSSFKFRTRACKDKNLTPIRLRLRQLGEDCNLKQEVQPDYSHGVEVAAALVGEKISAKMVKDLRDRSRAGILDCQKALRECDGDMEKAMDWLRKKGIAKADKKAGNIAAEGNVASYVHFNQKIGVIVEVNSETDFVASNAIFKEFTSDIAMQIAANPSIMCITAEEVPDEQKSKAKALEMAKEDLAGKPDNIKEKIVEGRLKKQFEEMALMNQKWLKDEEKTVQEVLKERIAKLGENLVIRRFLRLNLGEGLERKDTDFAAGVEAELAKYRADPNATPEEKPKEPEKPKEVEKPREEPKAEKKAVAVSAGQVKELRERSGAGILDSKKALAECDGDMDKAMEWLKKKGMAKADKKAGNLSVEGAIASYIHFNNKIGVLVEVNSETDFVAINAIFKEFASDVAMQIAANPSVVCVTTDEVPADVKEKEKAVEMSKEDLDGKPDNIKEKIVEGRLKKRYEEMALLNQKWLKDEEKTVQDVLKEKIAKLGENIVIRRFARLNLGEGLEKKDDDFAAGVEKELAKYRA